MNIERNVFIKTMATSNMKVNLRAVWGNIFLSCNSILIYLFDGQNYDFYNDPGKTIIND